MDPVIVSFAVAVALVTALAITALRGGGALWVRIGAVVIAALFMPAAYVGVIELLSRPKPVTLEWLRQGTSEATVLGTRIDENTAIHVWLELPGEDEPRAYVLPWNRSLAERIVEATEESKRTRGRVRLALPFQRGDAADGLRRVYAELQPSSPQKADPGPAAARYVRPEPSR